LYPDVGLNGVIGEGGGGERPADGDGPGLLGEIAGGEDPDEYPEYPGEYPGNVKGDGAFAVGGCVSEPGLRVFQALSG